MDVTDVYIRSVGTALPGPPIDNVALGARFGMEPVWAQWVEAFVGTRTRHLALDLDSGEVRQSLADLGSDAARTALERAGTGPGDIDVVVMGTASPDLLLPTTAHEIAGRLGLAHVPVFQLMSGCSGAFQALELAQRLLAAGAHRSALVLGGDVCAKHFDLTADLRALPPAEMVNAVLFGDGAGAAVLSTRPAAAGTGRPHTVLRTAVTRMTGLDQAPGQVARYFGQADRDSASAAVTEDYKAIEELVPQLAVDALAEVLSVAGWKESDVDYLLPPQLSGKMTATIIERLSLPLAEEVSCVEETANTGNALPFFQLERALDRMRPGDRAVAVAVESSKWITAGCALESVEAAA